MFLPNLHKSIVFLIIVVLIIAAGCSKESGDGTGVNGNDQYLWVHLNNDSLQVFFEDLEIFDITTLTKSAGENDAVWLSDFVDTTLIPMVADRDDVLHDTRSLYAYRMVSGDDGFSASIRGYPDNIWEHMSLGYIMMDTRQVVFPDELLDLPGAYNVSGVLHININRKVDVASTDSTGFTRLIDLESVRVENDDAEMEDAIPLQNIVTSFVLAPENHTYNLEAIDGYVLPSDLTWAQFQAGYWLLDSEKTWFTDAAFQTGQYKVKDLLKIVVN